MLGSGQSAEKGAKSSSFWTDNRVYRSVVRHGFPSTNRNRSLTVFSNFVLHIHPLRLYQRRTLAAHPGAGVGFGRLNIFRRDKSQRI